MVFVMIGRISCNYVFIHRFFMKFHIIFLKNIRFFKTSECCFFKLFKQNLLLSCECGSEFHFEPHNCFKQSAFVCAASPALFKKSGYRFR